MTRPSTAHLVHHVVIAGDNAAPARMVVTGEVDASNAPGLCLSILEVARSTRSPLQVDLAGVTFMDSSGLRAVEDASGALATSGCRIVVCGASRIVRRIIDIVGIADTVEVAV